MSEPSPFRLDEAPPRGTTVLEASAGTGKTFAIAALATRYVAEGTPLSRLLLVTFTRMATGELRDRVRQRLVSAERGLAAVLADASVDPDDEVLAVLADAAPEVLERRRRRLADAVAGYDAATIATIHQFCDEVLVGLGLAGDVDADPVFLTDERDLVDEAVRDLYLRRVLGAGVPPIAWDEARRIARVAVNRHDAALVPVDPRVPAEVARHRLATAVRQEVARRKRQAGVLTYDDLLTRLRDLLCDPERGAEVKARLRTRYDIALIDEFQDTDPVQWDIFRTLFDDATLVLIGDPKQAIYAFRGADVHTYLRAAAAHERRTLIVNQRSDAPLLRAFDALFDGASLGHPDIVYRPVQATGGHGERGLQGARAGAPLRIRVVERRDPRVGVTEHGNARPGRARALIVDDLTADVVSLLRDEPTIRDAAAASGHRQLVPGDIAVLVHRHADARDYAAALQDAGVPAVTASGGSVLASPAAQHWQRLLDALERPAAATRVRTLALGPFIGMSAEDVALAADARWSALHLDVRRWAQVLDRHGVAALLETLVIGGDLPARLLATVGGERLLTDLRHVAELLHAEAADQQLGVSALAGWLRQRRREADTDADTEEGSRRLESDADAVQVLTVHRSKGLEFAVVYAPTLWALQYVDQDALPVVHEGGQRVLDVGVGRRRWRAHCAEQRGEQLRLTYVALTRARHQAVVWWAGTAPARDAALTRLAIGRDGAAVPTWGDGVPSDAAARAAFEAIAARAPAEVAVETADAVDVGRWQPATSAAADLDRARLTRRLDASWRRTSFTQLTAAAHEPRIGSEVEVAVTTDEPELADLTALEPFDDDPRLTAPSPWSELPGGSAFGTLVHRVLEDVDFRADDLAGAVRARLAEVARGTSVEGLDAEALVSALAHALRTPLGTLLDGAALIDVDRRDRLDELAFELPVGGGDTPTGVLRGDDVADLLEAHLPADDTFAAYPARLRREVDGDVRGWLAGSIDLVVRVRRRDAPRYVLIDHKTNRLARFDEPLTLGHHVPSALAEAMQRAHYPLQALLYTVALHRYLRWRQRGYDPAVHLGDVGYLFLRGLAGPHATRVDGEPLGVLRWRPPDVLVEALSRLLDEGVAR